MSSHTGPISMSDPTARRQLEENGRVTTFRAHRRTTGDTWWRKTRTGKKEGDVHVRFVATLRPEPADLMPYQPLSGFEDVIAWRTAIRELNGSVPMWGYVYEVTTRDDQD